MRLVTCCAEGAVGGKGLLDEGREFMTKPFVAEALAARVRSIAGGQSLAGAAMAGTRREPSRRTAPVPSRRLVAYCK